MKNIKIKIAVVVLAAAFGFSAVQVRPAQALAFGVINSITWQDFFTDLAKGVAADILKSLTNSFVTNNVNKLSAQYGITKMLPYVNSVANQVYLSQKLQEQGALPQDNYIIKALANDSFGLLNSHLPLDPLYTQAATQSYDIFKLNQTTTGSQDFFAYLAKAGAFGSTPNDQKLKYQDLATTFVSTAQATANNDVAHNDLTKSSYSCDSPLNAGTGVTSVTQGLIVCGTQNPGKTVANSINDEINSAFDIENGPPQDHVGLLRAALSKTLSNIFLQKFLNLGPGTILPK